MALKGLLFDKDGTLIHFNETWTPAVLDVMRQQCAGDAERLNRLAQALDFDLDAPGFRPGALFVAGTWAASLAYRSPEGFQSGAGYAIKNTCKL